MISGLYQLIPFIFSFVFGILFSFCSLFIKFMLINKKLLTKIIINYVFVIDIVLLYVYFMYKINYGNHHIYYLFMLLFGFLLGNYLLNLCKHFVKRRK